METDQLFQRDYAVRGGNVINGFTKRPDEVRGTVREYDLDTSRDEETQPRMCHSKGITDLLDRQIERCASVTALQHAKQLTRIKKPTSQMSSWTFKSVIDEIHVEPAAYDADEPAASNNKKASLFNEHDADDSLQVIREDVNNNYVNDSNDELLTAAAVDCNENEADDLWKQSDNISRTDSSRFNQKKNRSSPMCRRTLYEKYLGRRDNWADGLTASGKQTLQEVQRKNACRAANRAHTAPVYRTNWRLASKTASRRLATANSIDDSSHTNRSNNRTFSL